MSEQTFPPTADISCPKCGAGWWATNPDKFAWTGCPDCGDEPTSVFEPDASRLALAVMFALAGVFWVGLVWWLVVRAW